MQPRRLSWVERIMRPLQWLYLSLRGLPSREELETRYWEAVASTLETRPDLLTREDAEHFLHLWIKSMVFSRGPLLDGWPWMTFPAMRHLEGLLDASSKVFEYGAGGSSIFFASRVGKLVSVEHDAVWFGQTEKALTGLRCRRPFDWRGVLAEPNFPDQPIELPSSDPLSYMSSDEALQGKSFHRYVSLIDEYPDNHFDVVLIDGRARPSCFLHAIGKVKVGGYIVLDNAERESYAWIEETARKLGFEVSEFWGPGPYNDYCWRTIFLRRTRRSHAVNDLDQKLEAYLDFDCGVFVEAGANDGIRQSNTLYFEANRSWRGVLVEALPDEYQQCRRNRPKAQVVWCALGAPEQVPGNATLRVAGLMSTVRGAMRSAEEEDAHIALGREVQNLPNVQDVTAPYATLSQIIDRCGISRVDLLSLDVEGYEAQALTGLDLSRHLPRFILVETRYREAVDAVLLSHYDAIADLSHHDVLYRLKENT